MLALWPMRLVALGTTSKRLGHIRHRWSDRQFHSQLGQTIIYSFLVVSIRHVDDLFSYVWAYVISCGILVFFYSLFSDYQGDQ